MKANVIKILGAFYKTESTSVDYLKRTYEVQKRKYPGLDLDPVFKVLNQYNTPTSTRESMQASLERVLRQTVSTIALNIQSIQTHTGTIPTYLQNFLNIIEKFSLKPTLEQSAPSSFVL